MSGMYYEPAFPGPAQSKTSVTLHEGMTLRDWFAGQALASMNFYARDTLYSSDAEMCYRMADAMVEARVK